ncbi:Longin domain [Dillenia turbinata]|uniref:Longin domain n=1 Tax=Dillenia turbinata TaxID=194707 RepID=A0AAN8VP91_9MAGN
MSQKGLIYSLVSEATVFVLAEHTLLWYSQYTAVQCLQKLPFKQQQIFLVVYDETVGSNVPFVFLERVKDDFKQHYAVSIKNAEAHPFGDEHDEDDLIKFEDLSSIAYNLDREFGPRLKEHMQYCKSHPEEISKLSKLKTR